MICNNPPCATPPLHLFEYLCLRIKETGIRSVHGVPGDFNLVALDYIDRCGLQWAGNCNELNAGYAADGYSRIHGISALMTVMGVGELSALNAIAGSFAEYVPVIHIISKPSRRAQEEKLCLHHTLGDGDFSVFEKMNAAVSCMTVSLDRPESAPGLIDEAIRQCWIQSRPVSIFIPSDIVQVSVDRNLLMHSLDLSMPKNDIEVETRAVDAIIKEIQLEQNPVLLIGGYGVTHDMIRDEVLELMEILKIPTLTSASGKGMIDEGHLWYAGLYVGECSDSHVLKLIRSTNLVISIGNIQSDLSTAGFTGKVHSLDLVDLQRNRVEVKGTRFPDIHVHGLLRALITKLKKMATISPETNYDIMKPLPIIDEKTRPSTCFPRMLTKICKSPLMLLPSIPVKNPLRKRRPITHDWLWTSLGQWLRDDDIILTETGTSSFGIWKARFPRHINFISQYLWSSIGYTVGACQGAALAVQDSHYRKRRTILFIGDGSIQCGCQELSTIIRLELAPIIFIICNNGYTVERLIHGRNQKYNDIQAWDYRRLPAVFGAISGKYHTHKVRTVQQLQDLFGRASFNNTRVLQLVELHVAQDDAPSNLIRLAQSLKKRNE